MRINRNRDAAAGLLARWLTAIRKAALVITMSSLALETKIEADAGLIKDRLPLRIFSALRRRGQ